MTTTPAFRISRPIFFLGLASFFTDTSSEMVYSLLPIFLTTTLGASALFVGVVEGVAESTAAFAKYGFGWMSDRWRKRTGFVVGGYGLANTVRPLIGLATAPWHVLVLRFTDRIGKGMRTAPRDAWLAGLVPASQRGRAYGFHRSMDHAGAVLGPLVATAYLYFFPGQLRSLFLWSVVPGLAAIFCVVAARRSHKEIPLQQDLSESTGEKISGSFYRFLGILFIFTLGGSSDAFLLLKLTSVGVEAKWIPALWALLHVVKSIGSYLGGRLTDRIGRKPSMILGWTWYAGVYALLGFFDSRGPVMAVFLAYGIYYGLTESAERALAADMVPAHARGRAFGLVNLVEGLGALPASLLFGVLWKSFGIPAAFYTSAVLALCASALLSFWRADSSRVSPP